MRYVVVKYETKPNAKSNDDIVEEKYLMRFILEFSPYPIKSWTKNIENSILFFNKEYANMVCKMLRVNTSYLLKIEEVQ